MKQPKPTTGKLIQKLPGGRTRILEEGKTFPALQEIKKDYIRYGFKKCTLKITY